MSYWPWAQGVDPVRLIDEQQATIAALTQRLVEAERERDEAVASVAMWTTLHDMVSAEHAACHDEAAHYRREELEARAVEAERRAEALKATLQELVDHQNGPPLPSYEKGWQAAMDKAEELLDA